VNVQLILRLKFGHFLILERQVNMYRQKVETQSSWGTYCRHPPFSSCLPPISHSCKPSRLVCVVSF